MNNTPLNIRPFKTEPGYFAELDSTNAELKRRLDAGNIRHGECVQAGFQSSGRGQMGSTWLGNAGENLYMSLYVELNLPVEAQFRLNILVAIAVAEVLAFHGLQVQLKWPNDVFCDGKKLGGILIENQVNGSLVKNSIIGIGVNLNQNSFGELEKAASLFSLGGKKTDPSHFAAALLEQLQWRLSGLNKAGDELQEYYKRLLFFDRYTTFEVNSRLFTGRVAGIDNWGRLLVEENGEISRYSVKEIKWKDL